MPNPYVNKVQLADGTSLIDISDTTATASDVKRGKYFYTADGAKTAGTGAYIETVSDSSVVSFSNGSNWPALSLKVNIDPVQKGSGDPSPSNIREIVGWGGMDLRHAKGNLWGGDELLDDVSGAISSASVSTTNKTVQFTYNSTASHEILGGDLCYGLRFKPDTRYTFILSIYKSSSVGSNMRINYTDGTNDIIYATQAGTKHTFRKVSTEGKSIKSVTKIASGGTTRLYANECGIFEGVHTVEEYVSYAGKSVKIGWTDAGTVYGGVLDVLSGELTVTHGQIASYDGETLPGEWISDRDVYAENTSPSTGAQVIYELDAPQVYQINPEQIRIFENTNNFWANTGGIRELVYVS